VSYRRFHGWEPATVTTHEYDQDGRLLRSTARQEAEFDDSDRAMFLGLQEYEDGLCPNCGLPLDETTDGGNEFAYRHGERVRCHACGTQAQWVHAQQDGMSDVDRASVLFTPPSRAPNPVRVSVG
jgi:hypothetical protein